jgi:2-methylisocitrate lyase-like PEP mutase family enzyme
MTAKSDLAPRAEALRELHRAPELLVLPNAWDAASARLIAGELGFPAVATTSAGVAEALGFADGEATPPEAMLAAVGRIAAAVDVPLTADMEAGYGLSAETLVDSLLASGAVGLNIEDTDHRGGGDALVAVERQVARLGAIKAAGHAEGVDVVLNARVDSFLRGSRDVAGALERARAYVAAGADCVYPIGIADEATIATFVEGAGAPVNVFMRPGVPSLARLGELGVARVTWGAGLFRTALAAVREQLSADGR